MALATIATTIISGPLVMAPGKVESMGQSIVTAGDEGAAAELEIDTGLPNLDGFFMTPVLGLALPILKSDTDFPVSSGIVKVAYATSTDVACGCIWTAKSNRN